MVRPMDERKQDPVGQNFCRFFLPEAGLATASRFRVEVLSGRYTYERMSQAFAIREYRKSDFSRLWEIDQKCFPAGISYSQPELLFYMRRPRAFTLVAETGKDLPVVGFIVAEVGR